MQEKLNSNESKVAKVTILRTTALVLLSNACDCQPNIAIGTVFGMPDRFFSSSQISFVLRMGIKSQARRREKIEGGRDEEKKRQNKTKEASRFYIILSGALVLSIYSAKKSNCSVFFQPKRKLGKLPNVLEERIGYSYDH